MPSAGLLAYPGEVTDQAILTVDYSGIRQATKTTATNARIAFVIQFHCGRYRESRKARRSQHAKIISTIMRKPKFFPVM